MNYILSYPRSGSTWIRYCIEYLSKKPTIGSYSKHPTGHHSNIISSLIDLGVDETANPIFLRTHDPKDIPGKSKIIFLLRNYKEVIIRHQEMSQSDNLLNSLRDHIFGEEQGSNYLKLINFFDSYPGEKLIIYYEDLISNPDLEIRRLAKFISAEGNEMESLISNLEEHKKNSLKVYGKSKTGGNEKIVHSKVISDKDKNQIDSEVKSRNPKIYDNYLTRYGENRINIKS